MSPSFHSLPMIKFPRYSTDVVFWTQIFQCQDTEMQKIQVNICLCIVHQWLSTKECNLPNPVVHSIGPCCPIDVSELNEFFMSSNYKIALVTNLISTYFHCVYTSCELCKYSASFKEKQTNKQTEEREASLKSRYIHK